MTPEQKSSGTSTPISRSPMGRAPETAPEPVTRVPSPLRRKQARLVATSAAASRRGFLNWAILRGSVSVSVGTTRCHAESRLRSLG